MVDELRGITGPDEILTALDAARFMDVDVEASEEEIEDAFTELTLQIHPDQGGTQELFLALKKSKDILEGTETAGVGAAGSSRPGQGRQADEGLVNSIEEMLRDRFTEQQIKEQYFEDTEFRDIAEILASLVLSGSIDLGSLERMVTGDDRFSSDPGSATGGTYSKGGGSNFGGGNAYASSDPNDYMGYGNSSSGSGRTTRDTGTDNTEETVNDTSTGTDTGDSTDDEEPEEEGVNNDDDDDDDDDGSVDNGFGGFAG